MAKRSSKKSAKSEMEDFLSAPDASRKSESERKKYETRKEHDSSRAARLKNSKHRGDPSLEDVLADLVRVAEDEVHNPYWRDRTLSRKRYQRFGHWDLVAIEKSHGQFEHVKQMAGLTDQPGTRLQKSARSQRSRVEHAERYVKRYVMPYVGDPSERNLTGTELVLSISDTHGMFLDPFTWWCFLNACRDLEPEIIFLNGDILEMVELSRHPKIPGWTAPLQMEFDFARGMFEQLRELCPDADIWWGAGNHGLDRLSMYLTQVAPAMANLDCLRFDKLAGLEDLGIKLAQGGWIASPREQEHDAEGTLLHGFYRVYHGRRLGQFPAGEELKLANRSGQSGHVHRPQLAFGTNEVTAGMSWMSTPMGCSPRAGRAYMRGLTTQWTRGFGLAFLSPGDKVHQYPVSTEGGRCFFEGFEYVDPGFAEPDPQRNWIKDFKIPK